MNSPSGAGVAAQVAGIADFLEETPEICRENYPALAGLYHTGNDVGQHQAWKCAVRYAVRFEFIIHAAQYNKRKSAIGLFPVAGFRVAVRQGALNEFWRVVTG